MPYSAPLDAIRAIAILAVLIFHISPGALNGGFMGVDVFFVLSGFLITTIILRDLMEDRFSLPEFYLRRIQRLLPNIITMVLTVILLWTLLLPPSMTPQVGSHGLWTIFNGSNFYILKNLGGYWGESAEWAPFTHTWSLGVEEQFYLVFPALLWLLARFQSGRIRQWLAAATCLSFGLCLYGTYTHPTATFYLLPTRVWELLIGSILAAHLQLRAHGAPQSRPAFRASSLEFLGCAGVALVFSSFIFNIKGGVFPGWIALAPTLGTLLILISVLDGKTRLSRLLSLSPLVNIGKISYSIYLWHWPLIILGKILADFYGKPQIYGALAGAILSIPMAWAAYACVEQPLRRRGGGRPRRFAIIVTGFITAMVSCWAVASRHMPPADPANLFDRPTFHGGWFNAGKQDVNASLPARLHDVDFPEMKQPIPDDSWRSGGIVNLYGADHPQIVVLGSSHAEMYSMLIDSICRKLGLSVAFLCMGHSTPAFFESTINPSLPTLREAREFDQARKRWIQKWRPEAVFIIDKWDATVDTPGNFGNRIRSFLEDVCPLAGSVLFVAQAPAIRGGDQVNLREVVTWRRSRGGGMPQFFPDRFDPQRNQATAIAETTSAFFPNFHVLRADQAFCNPDGSIRYFMGRHFFYMDSNHLTDDGTQVVHDLFQDAIAQAHSLSAPG